MFTNLKALVVVLAIASAVFWFAKPVVLEYTSEPDFVRRRTVWFALTVAAFLIPNFWLFCVVSAPIMVWAGRRDPNPIGLYLLILHVIPQMVFELPPLGPVNRILGVDIFRLLALFILVPLAWRLRGMPRPARGTGLLVMDVLLVAYLLLQLFQAQEESATSFIRRALEYFLDVYVLYYAVSRSCTTRAAIVDALAMFWLSCLIMAVIAVFEAGRSWLLYAGVGQVWGDPTSAFYLFRGDALRAQASSGHSLALGYILAISLGFFLYLRSRLKPSPRLLGLLGVIAVGLLASFARAPWMGALLIYLVFLALGPQGIIRVAKTLAVFLLAGAVILVSPLGEKVINVLPFVGNVDSDTVLYRQQLAAKSWELIGENPFFGDPYVLNKMESLRQGQGIIDLVNTYAAVALFYGLVGLALFVGFILVAGYQAYTTAVRARRVDRDFSLIGFGLVTCIIGTMLMITSCSFILGYQKMFYVIAGLAAGYVTAARARRIA